jgi:hypothetical protein
MVALKSIPRGAKKKVHLSGGTNGRVIDRPERADHIVMIIRTFAA